MGERFSNLQPLDIESLEKIMFDMVIFFKPQISLDGKSLITHSVNDFMNAQKDKEGESLEKYRHQIISLVKKLELNNFLCAAGAQKGFSLGGEKCYYFIKELSNLQRTNLMWFGECLGLEYVQHKAKDFVVPITGISNGKVGIGTGTLINSDTILTCAHVIEDMKLDETIKIRDSDVKIKEVKNHKSIDVGIIKISQHIDYGYQMIFGNTCILDEILTMGYPPVPMTIDAYLISQKGEINSIVKNHDKKEYFLYSSITRPGNSGGPIFNKRGYLIGISARHLENQDDKDKSIVPFFQGIPSEVILDALLELDPNLNYKFENYE